MREDEPCPPRVPSSRRENEHPLPPECIREPEVPQWKRRHVLHRREPATVPVPAEPEPSAEIIELSRFGPRQWPQHSSGDAAETSRDKAAHSANRSRYDIRTSLMTNLHAFATL